MKLSTVIATVAIAAGLSVVAAPAQADDCLTVPEMPGDCLTAEGYEYVTQLQRDNESLELQVDLDVSRIGMVEGKLLAAQTSLDLSYKASALLVAQLKDVREESAARRARVERLLFRVQLLRAELRAHGF